MSELKPNVEKQQNYQLSVDEIQRFLPHRQPFLLIDRVLEIIPSGSVGANGSYLSADGKVGTKVRAIKCVTFNEPFFQGHFPGFAIMPGVLLIEAMAQTASMAVYPYMAHDLSLARNFQSILVGVDGVRFRRPVVPGDRLVLTAVVSKCRGKLWGFDCQIEVEGHKVAEASILANLQPAEGHDGQVGRGNE